MFIYDNTYFYEEYLQGAPGGGGTGADLRNGIQLVCVKT